MFKKFFSFIVLCIIYNLVNSYVTITSRSITSPLEKYKSYKDVDMIHLHIPQDTIFASFKFMADETRMSIFCKKHFYYFLSSTNKMKYYVGVKNVLITLYILYGP